MPNAFISYTGHAEPDAKLAHFFAERLDKAHKVFIQTRIAAGQSWPDVVDAQLQQADFVILLLSTQSASSDMVIEEVRRAVRLKETHGRPAILPVRLGDVEMPYDLAAKVNRIQHLKWAQSGDEEDIAARLEAILSGAEAALDDEADWPSPKAAALSTDGAQVAAQGMAAQPLPAFDPSWLKSLDAQGGAVRLDSPFYVARTSDEVCMQRLEQKGSTLLISGARQTGKSSLLARLYQAAADKKIHTVYLDFQSFGKKELESMDSLLLAIANQLYDDLSLNAEPTADWKDRRSAAQNLTRYIERQVIGQGAEIMLLLMDEVDRLFDYANLRDDFFALVRFWITQRAFGRKLEWLNLVLAYSTEASMFIKNQHQSPFNVGEKFDLGDFDLAQLQLLNARHGSPIQSQEELDGFMQLLGGHPFLVRKALYELVAWQRTPAQIFSTSTDDDGPFGDHLRFYMLAFRESPDLCGAMRAVLDGAPCPDDLSFYRLRSAGLVRGPDRLHATARCGLYSKYFGAHL